MSYAIQESAASQLNISFTVWPNVLKQMLQVNFGLGDLMHLLKHYRNDLSACQNIRCRQTVLLRGLHSLGNSLTSCQFQDIVLNHTFIILFILSFYQNCIPCHVFFHFVQEKSSSTTK